MDALKKKTMPITTYLMHGSLYDAFDATLIALDVELQYEHDSMLTIPRTLAPRIAGRVVETEEVPGRFLFAHDGVGVRVHELPRIFHIDVTFLAVFFVIFLMEHSQTVTN